MLGLFRAVKKLTCANGEQLHIISINVVETLSLLLALGRLNKALILLGVTQLKINKLINSTSFIKRRVE
jgi:hypothetical protein